MISNMIRIFFYFAFKIDKLISYIDESLDSFIGYRLELLFLLSTKHGNINKTNSLYKQIIEDNRIS